MQRKFSLNNLDLLRLLAATQVLIFHSIHHLNISNLGYWTVILEYFPGVPVFFVISGYLISRSFEKKHDIKNYFRNRFLRIYPGLWGCILATIITASIFGSINFLNKPAFAWLIAQLVGIIYTPAFLKNYGFGSYNGALWTIPIELQFYIVMPAFYFLLKKLNQFKYFFLILWVFFICLSFFLKKEFPAMGTIHESIFEKLLRYTFAPNIWLFLTGVLLQRGNAFQSKWIYGKGIFWLAAYIALSIMLPTSDIMTFVMMLLLGVTTISLAYTMPSLAGKLLKGNDISYGVYLYHGVIINVFIQLSFIGHLSLIWYILLISYTLAFISWKLIEKPMMKKKVNALLVPR